MPLLLAGTAINRTYQNIPIMNDTTHRQLVVTKNLYSYKKIVPIFPCQTTTESVVCDTLLVDTNTWITTQGARFMVTTNQVRKPEN